MSLVTRSLDAGVAEIDSAERQQAVDSFAKQCLDKL